MEFEGKVCVVTGAAGNLGRAVAARLSAAGGSVIMFDQDAHALNAAAEALNGPHQTVVVDLLDWAAVTDTVSAVHDRHGAIDVLCAVAGGFAMGDPVHEAAPEVWQNMQDLNVGTLLPIVSAVVPNMIERGSGRIITVGANAAHQGMPHMGPYCAAKSGVMRITESLAAELRDKGIGVNCVLPSILDTPENRSAMPDVDPAQWVDPVRLADVIAFLASDAAADLHGALVPVTGLS